MDKIDFRQELKELYAPKGGEFSIVNVPSMSFLMVDGEGDPNKVPAYAEALEALYGVAYVLKFASKKELGKDYVVPPLEGLWTADDMTAFVRGSKDEYKWTMMIMQPDWITSEMVAAATKTVASKKDMPALPRLRFDRYNEGESVQILYTGAYDDEGPVIQQLHLEYLPSHSLTENGKHHEIYLSDPRKTEPSKLKTILRQPVKALRTK